METLWKRQFSEGGDSRARSLILEDWIKVNQTKKMQKVALGRGRNVTNVHNMRAWTTGKSGSNSKWL